MRSNFIKALFFVLSMIQVTAFAEEGADLQIGSRVSYHGFAGNVLQLWKNDMARVAFDKDLGVLDIEKDQLDIMVQCLDGICVGDKVITDFLLPTGIHRPLAVVLQVYSNGDAALLVEGLERPTRGSLRSLHKL